MDRRRLEVVEAEPAEELSALRGQRPALPRSENLAHASPPRLMAGPPPWTPRGGSGPLTPAISALRLPWVMLLPTAIVATGVWMGTRGRRPEDPAEALLKAVFGKATRRRR